MAQLVDNYMAYRILSLLMSPFSSTEAFRLGIIDAEGNLRVRPSQFTTAEQKNAYTYFHRVVFKLKQLLDKLPGGQSVVKNLIATYYLAREAYETKSPITESQLTKIVDLMNGGLILAEEQLVVEEFLQLLSEDGAGAGGGAAPAGGIANVTGHGVSTDIPVIRKKKRFGRFTVNDEVYNRFPEGKANFRKIASYLNMEDEGQQLIHKFAMKNPGSVIVLHNGKNKKVIRNGDRWTKRTVKQVNNNVVT